MEWVEITAKTVEAAKERALDELGIGSDEAEFVVVEEPKRGLFHQLRGTARVRARVAPRTPRAKTDRRSRRGKKAEDPGDGDRSAPSARAKDGGRNGDKSGRRATSTRAQDHPDVTDDGSSPTGERPRTKSKKSAKSAKPAKPATTPKEEGTTMSMTLDEQVAATETFLEGLLDAIGFEGTIVTERVDEANAHVNVEGDNLGLLIGPRGNTMNAIQDLTRIVLQKQAAGSWEGHVHVDINGYRAKRRAALVTFVEKVAADVGETGSAKALEPMSASDRKLVHDTVNDIDGVTTTSEGHEPRRWVKIVPAEA